jgi:thiamine pyrophosphokinase
MSSHHIVRENQEPALLIADAHAISFEKIQELLEWMPTVVVLSTQVETVIAWGIKVDVVITPLAEMTYWRDKLAEQIPIRFISYNPDDEPLETAFYFLIASKAGAVNCLLSSKDGLKKIESFSNLDIEAFVDNELWSCIKKGHFEKWLPAGTTLYLLPEGMKSEFPEFTSGNYLTQKDGIVRLTSTHSFWIGEELS